MTDKERIIAEVERYKNEIISDNKGTDYEMGFIAALESIETLISNILKEPINKDLKEAADNYIKGFHYAIKRMNKESFIDGANWQKEKTINKACEWLKEHYIMYVTPSIKSGVPFTTIDGDKMINDLKQVMEG